MAMTITMTQTEENVGSVGLVLNQARSMDMDGKQSDDYRVHIPLLTHTACACQIYRPGWDESWCQLEDGILDATYITLLEPFKEGEIRRNNLCKHCAARCSSCVRSLHYFDRTKQDPVTFSKKEDACMYPFVINIFNSDLGMTDKEYTEADLPDLDTVIHFMKLYGVYGTGEGAILYPWDLQNMNDETRERVQQFINDSRGYKTEKITMAMKDSSHPRWDEVQCLFEQLLACAHYGYPFKPKKYEEIYQSALKSWRKIMKDPNRVPDKKRVNWIV